MKLIYVVKDICLMADVGLEKLRQGNAQLITEVIEECSSIFKDIQTELKE